MDVDASTYDVNIRKETFVYDGQAGFVVVWRTRFLCYYGANFTEIGVF